MTATDRRQPTAEADRRRPLPTTEADHRQPLPSAEADRRPLTVATAHHCRRLAHDVTALYIVDGSAVPTAITTKLIANATCEQQRPAIAADATDLAATGATQSPGLAWYIGYARSGRRLRAACRASKAGAVLAMLDEPAGVNGWPELEPMLTAMVAARL